MNAKMFGCVLLLLSLAACVPASTAAPIPTETPPPTSAPSPTPAPVRTAVFRELENEVASRASEAEEFAPASLGQVLNAGGQARTGEPGKARLDLMPEATIVRMPASTNFTVAELSQSVNDPSTRLRLTAGKIWVILSGGSLEVETEIGIAGVRGSLMGVSFDTMRIIMTATCLEGTCSLANPAGHTDLVTGQAADIPAPGQPPSASRPLTAAEILDWTRNNPEAIPFADPPAQTLEIPKADGGALPATMNWSLQCTSWTVVLDAMVYGSQKDWTDAGVTPWLLGQSGPLDSAGASLPADAALNVLTYDPTGHGGAAQNWSSDSKSWPDDAKIVAQGVPQASDGCKPMPPCNIFVGASTGADRAFFSCAASPGNCAGVVALSPGGFLDVPFAQEWAGYQQAWQDYVAAGDFTNKCPALDPAGSGAKFLCVASSGDPDSARTCQSVTAPNFRSQIFDGQQHGLSYFDEGSAFLPTFRDFLVSFLSTGMP